MTNKTVGGLLCYCGKRHWVTEEDLGFAEFECDCGIFLQVPEDPSELGAYNDEIQKTIDKNRYTGTVRFMAIQETGEESCLRNGVDETDEELIELLLVGYQQKYPEWVIFTEREELHC